jgi:putative endonuclease
MRTKSAKPQETGKIGEDLAARFLERLGYIILDRNKRFGKCEIDLICCKDRVIHFFEVKTRRGLRYGWPEQHVKPRKIYRMMKAAQAFSDDTDEDSPVQLNIVSIVIVHPKPPIYYLIEDIGSAYLL